LRVLSGGEEEGENPGSGKQPGFLDLCDQKVKEAKGQERVYFPTFWSCSSTPFLFEVETEPDPLLLRVECIRDNCRKPFLICIFCYQDPVYCSDQCKKAVRSLELLTAGKKYQESEKGRLNHSKRQRAYRERLKKAGVTHQTSCTAKPDWDKMVESVSPSILWKPPGFADGKQLFCCICGRPGRLIDGYWQGK